MPKAYNARDQAKHFAAVVVCCRALPKRSRSRQSNKSAVDTSCTSMAYKIQQEEIPKWLTLWKSEGSQKLKRTEDSEIHVDLRVLGRDLQTVRPARPKGSDGDHPPHSTFVDAVEKSFETEVPACLVRRSHGRDISLIRHRRKQISQKRNIALRPVI